MGGIQSFQKTVLEPILFAIDGFPENNAIYSNNKFYTYRQLGEYIRKVRSFVKAQLMNNVVGVVDNSDFETYATAIALWMEGVCVVPLQPTWPLQRWKDVVNASHIVDVFDSLASATTTTRIVGVSEWGPDDVVAGMTLVSGQRKRESELACILFTSGSTGVPKGVMISQRGVAAAIDAFWGTGITIEPSDRCLQCMDMSFAVSLQTIITPLQKGACIYLIPSGQIKYAYAIALIDEFCLSVCTMVFSMAVYILPYLGKIHHDQMKYFMVFGEPCRLNTIRTLQAIMPQSEIDVLYGATETTIHVTCNRLKREVPLSHNGIVSVGKPLEGVKIMICDEKAHSVSSGQKGELCVGGEQITPGYLWMEESRDGCFFTRVIDGENVRFYRTGDCAFQTANGYVHLCGRLNSMVKIQGNRVDLNEIECVAVDFLSGTNVICLPCEREDHLAFIVMFIESSEIPVDGLKAYLRKRLPPYMMPEKYVFIDRFPLNPHGKIDRKKLNNYIYE